MRHSKFRVRAADGVPCSATSGSKMGLLAEDVANVKFSCRKQGGIPRKVLAV